MSRTKFSHWTKSILSQPQHHPNKHHLQFQQLPQPTIYRNNWHNSKWYEKVKEIQKIVWKDMFHNMKWQSNNTLAFIQAHFIEALCWRLLPVHQILQCRQWQWQPSFWVQQNEWIWEQWIGRKYNNIKTNSEIISISNGKESLHLPTVSSHHIIPICQKVVDTCRLIVKSATK